MKLHFEPNLDFQRNAIEAVCDLFRGQEICRTEFTVTSDIGLQLRLPGMENELGIGKPACIRRARNVNDLLTEGQNEG